MLVRELDVWLSLRMWNWGVYDMFQYVENGSI